METGVFHEAYKYSKNFNLPIQWVVEDNDMSVHTPTEMAWGKKQAGTRGCYLLQVRNGISSPRNRKVG
jgi:TPP-dependent pyruvate/acetoin dehydrogenase alpha subunit